MFPRVIPLVDLQRRGGELLPGQIGGTHFLAAIAHNTGKRVQHLGLGQVKKPRSPKLLDTFILEVNGVQGTKGLAFRSGHVIQRGHKEVGVLAVGEIGQKGKDEPKREPPRNMFANGEGACREPLPQSAGQGTGKGLPGVWIVERDFEGGAEETSAHVAQDEEAHNQRILGDTGGRFGV